jgi:hypothetical protein
MAPYRERLYSLASRAGSARGERLERKSVADIGALTVDVTSPITL